MCDTQEEVAQISKATNCGTTPQPACLLLVYRIKNADPSQAQVKLGSQLFDVGLTWASPGLELLDPGQAQVRLKLSQSQTIPAQVGPKANKQTSERANKQATNKQTSKHANKQASKQASKVIQ